MTISEIKVMNVVFNKRVKLFILLILLIYSSFFPDSLFSIIPTGGLEVTPNTTVELKDVVIVNYTLYIDTDIIDKQEGIVYVEDPDKPVPGKIIEQFPNIRVPPNIGFLEGLIGMKANENKTLEVLSDSGKAFNNFSDPLYGEDLFYQIILLEILLDATILPLTIFNIPFFDFMIGLTVIVILIIIFFRIQRYSQSHNLFGLKPKCIICHQYAEGKCGNPACNTTYCKKCFREKGCVKCQSNTLVPIKS